VAQCGMAENFDDAMVFVRVVQCASFTAAAKSLGLPKTTVSRRVRELERHLGAQLLQRTTRQLGLTEAGQTYFRHCEPLAAMLKQAEAAVGQLSGEPRGRLRVTAPYTTMINLIAPLLGSFHERCPQVVVDLVLGHKVQDLVREEIDVALRLGPLPDSSLSARRLAEFPNRIYASPAYLARFSEPMHPSELIQHKTLATRVAVSNDGYAWKLWQDGRVQEFPIRPIIVADDPEVLKAPLVSGHGLMLATDMIMQPLIAHNQVRPVLDGWTGRQPQLHAVFPRGPILPQKVRAFVDFLAERLDGSY
jgi:LysR family transcriptional regulator for bpeEF and oprC